MMAFFALITRSSIGTWEQCRRTHLRQSMEDNGMHTGGDEQRVSDMLNSVVDVLNSFQDFIGSPSR